MKKIYIISNFICILFFSFSLTSASDAFANTDVLLVLKESKITANCGIGDYHKFGSESENAIDWCIKACQTHGFDLVDNLRNANSIYEESAKLSKSYWGMAEKDTPRECLPYKPSTLKNSLDKKCLTYHDRMVVSGMLSNYLNLGFFIKSPEPNCIKNLAGDVRSSEAENLNDIMLELSPSDKKKFRKLLGNQISVTGLVSYKATGDTAVFSLSSVKLIRQE